VNAIKHLKGSDASNAHDEEIGEDELEFSDDEEERAHKRASEHKRSASRSNSRQPTPSPSQMRDQEMSEEMYGQNPYDLMYSDPEFGAGPSRPAPVPYDDPYSDSYGLETSLSSSSNAAHDPPPPRNHDSRMGVRGHERPPTRGRGRGQDRQRNDRGRGRGRGRGNRNGDGGRRPSIGRPPAPDQGDTAGPARPLSPTSLAIARATGQHSDGTTYASSSVDVSQPDYGQNWNYTQLSQPQPYGFHFDHQQPYVQPHINPRFASSLGFGVPYIPQNAYSAYGAEFSVPLSDQTWPSHGETSSNPHDNPSHGSGGSQS